MVSLRIVRILASTGLACLTFIFFPPVLSEEYLLVPRWAFSEMESGAAQSGAAQSGTAQSGAAQSAPGGDWLPLKLDNELLFVNGSGEYGQRIALNFHYTYTSRGFINTTQYHDSVIQHSPLGELRFVDNRHGFPLLFESAIAFITPDGLGFEVLDENHDALFKHRYASLITQIDAYDGETGLVIATGLLDGRYFVYAIDGSLLYEGIVGEDSQIPVVYGLELMEASFDMQEVRHLYVSVVGGYPSASMEVAVLDVQASGESVELAFVKEDLGLKLTGVQEILMYQRDATAFHIALPATGGFADYRFASDLRSAAEIQVSSNVPRLRSIKELPKGGYFRHYSDDDKSLLEIELLGGSAVMRRQLPFRSDAGVLNDSIIIRGGGLLSAYDLEEG